MHVGVSPWYNVSHTVMNSVWPWPLTSISKLYFHNEFESGKMSALWHRHIKFFHIGVSPWDKLCTFSTIVWLWPLTYMWVAGGILSEFYSQFISCFNQKMVINCTNFKENPNKTVARSDFFLAHLVFVLRRGHISHIVTMLNWQNDNNSKPIYKGTQTLVLFSITCNYNLLSLKGYSFRR